MMPMCECCWSASYGYGAGTDQAGEYHEQMKQHAARGCICTKDTPEGRKAKAGQFWDEERQCDRREPEDTP